MILRSVELENFGRFRGRTVEFRRGMNLVIGPNEAGKSTLAEAVPAVLFGTDRLERFKPWGRNLCAAALFFEGGGRTVQIRRNLVTDDVELLEKDDLYHVLAQFTGKVPLRGRSASCREYRDLLEKLLGVSDERLFRATYFFGHHPQEWTGDELAQKLRTLVSGTAEADYAEIMEGLLAEHFQLTRCNPWGRDKQRDREYEDVCRQLSQRCGDGNVPVFVEIDDSSELEAQISLLSDELAGDRREYEKGLRYIERVRREARTEVENGPVEDASDPRIQVAAPATSVISPGRFTAIGLPENPPRELPELLSEAAAIRQELAALQQPYAALNQRELKTPKVPWQALCGFLVLLSVITGVAWWLDFSSAPLMLGVGICLALLSGWGCRRSLSRRQVLAECRTQRHRLDQQKLAAQKRQSALSERCDMLGLPSSAVDLVRLQKLVAAHRELLESFWNSDNPRAAESTAERDDRTAETVVSLETSKGGASSDDLEQLQVRMAEFAEGLRCKEDRLQALRRQLQGASAKPLLREGTPVAVLQDRKHELEERIAVLRKAVNLLAEAVDEFGRSHLVRLNHEAGKLFGKMTGGRYAALRLDENMAPSVRIDERRWVGVEHLSRGTVDALYLALRMALARVRDDGRSLPLMLDDPFVHLDPKRLSTALNLLDLAALDGQLILFSHNQELGKRAARERWQVIALDSDSIDASTEEGGEHAGQLHLL